MHPLRVLPVAALAAALLALSACGADAGDGYTANPAPLSGPAQPPSERGSGAAATTPAPAEGGAVLVARDTPGLGRIVTDAQGYALYRFDQDTAQPPTATCEGECAAKWPPIIVDPEGKLSLTGVDQSLIGMVQRSDGTSQLTLGGWALYRYSGDTPGTTNGHAIGNTWFAVTAEGRKAPATP